MMFIQIQEKEELSYDLNVIILFMTFNESYSHKQSFKQHESPIFLVKQEIFSERSYQQEFEEYLYTIYTFQYEVFTPQSSCQAALKEHNMKIISNNQLVLMRDNMKLKKTDCLFSVVQTHFHGLQYIYEILIGPFLMKISVLNLNRDSDDGDEDIDKQQIGAGGFGSVRAVRIKNEEYAIKRIPFKFKMQSSSGYDFQAESNEQYQLRRCLREFCMFKICSFMGIGPKLINSSYDLICFNNCIQFKMELCEPIVSYQFYMNHKEVSIFQLKSELMAKLTKLHCLNIVHRDIKPENLLYSNSRQCFIFGDFGMNILLVQNFNQKTLTKFAGTAQYCGNEMKILLNGQSGYVNLYLNDYCSLKITLNCLENQVSKESSEISMNNMSYRQQSCDELIDFQHFSINQNSNSSSRTQTDSSYPVTGQSLINFTTASTQAPKKLATSINHHESEIIYYICRRLQRKEDINQKTLISYMDSIMDKSLGKQLFQNVALEVSTIFFANKNASAYSLQNKLKQWKNISRHYGPQSHNAVKILQNVIQDITDDPNLGSSHVLQEVREVQRQITSKGKKPISSESEMKLYRILGHFKNYIYSFIDFLRFQINQKDKYQAQNSQQFIKRVIFVSKQYLFCIKSKELLSYQAKMINRLIFVYLNDSRIQPNDIKSRLYMSKLGDFCYNFLKEKDELTYSDLACLISYKIDFIRSDCNQIKKLMQEMKSFYDPNKQDEILNVNFAAISVKFLHYYPQEHESANMFIQFTLSNLKQQTYENLFIKLELMIYLMQKKIPQQVLKLQPEVTNLLNKYRGKFINWDIFNIIKLKVIGQSYLQLDLEKSSQFLKNTLEQLIKCYGLKKYLQISFQILNNLTYLNYKKDDFKLQRKYLTDMKDLLLGQKGVGYNYYIKLIYVRQQLLRVLIRQGLKSKADQEECAEHINWIIVNLSKAAQPLIIFSLSRAEQLIGAIRQNCEKYLVHFIHMEIYRSITANNFHLMYASLYLQVCLSISEYLFKQVKKKNECLIYLWQYIQFKQNFLSSPLGQFDYQVYNLFARILMECNSYRRAIIFLKRYIFKIPKCLFNVKKKAFELMYKASVQLNERDTKIYYELIRNNATLLFSQDYSSLLFKQRSRQKRTLIKKWLDKI